MTLREKLSEFRVKQILYRVDIALYVHPKNSLRSHLRAMTALDHSRYSLRTADAFLVVASLPPKNIFRGERSDDRKCVCCSQAITYLALGFSTVNYKKGKYIRPQIEVFTYNFPFTDYNTPCLLEKNCTCSFLSHSINLKKFLLLRIFVCSFLTKLAMGLRPVKGLFKVRVGPFEVLDLGN